MKYPALKLFIIFLTGVLACVGGFVIGAPKVFFIGDALAWLLVGGFIHSFVEYAEGYTHPFPMLKLVCRLIIFAAGNQLIDEIFFDPTQWAVNDFLVWGVYAFNEIRLYRKSKKLKKVNNGI